jgi:hypothetical protein
MNVLLRRELGPSGWLFGEVDWDADNGIRIAPTAADWKALIAEKQKNTMYRMIFESYLNPTSKI